MKEYIIIIGLGSMGKRRIRLLKALYKDVSIIGIEKNEDRQREVEELYHIDTYAQINELPHGLSVKGAFVCTSPLSHNYIIRECLELGWNVFTELNLVTDGYEQNMRLARENDCVLFLSSTFFYREEIRYIREYLKGKRNLNYIYHIGQYLPDWHPWENYRNFFVGADRTNGCREVFAIELPWITETFGKVEKFHVISDKMSSLEISYNDNYIVSLVHENGNKGTLIVDVVSPVATRKLEAYGEKSYVSWDASKVEIKYFDERENTLKNAELTETVSREKGYGSFIVENAYKNEIREFFEVVNKRKKPTYGFEEDFEILRLIDKIEGKE